MMIASVSTPHTSSSLAAPADAVVAAEAAGFEAAMCSDHFAPWSERQGHSGYAWTWLGAALQPPTCSIGRGHRAGAALPPGLTAQAIATLGEMFPGRFWAALGSGEAINEHVTGDPWPRRRSATRGSWSASRSSGRSCAARK